MARKLNPRYKITVSEYNIILISSLPYRWFSGLLNNKVITAPKMNIVIPIASRNPIFSSKYILANEIFIRSLKGSITPVTDIFTSMAAKI
mmetsp:Transcript_18457/g.16330  ORF Transcript_18457/g.16330 Transcript_18457/m.16330 type:complete len:90 (+) Transcript_18457:793-1062(+)